MKLYPVSVSVNIHFTDGETDGTANFVHSLGRLPTEEDMPEILDRVMEALPEGFRLMSRHESMMHFLREEKGYQGPNLALPDLADGEEWHDPATANTYSFNDDPDEIEF